VEARIDPLTEFNISLPSSARRGTYIVALHRRSGVTKGGAINTDQIYWNRQSSKILVENQ
jgi:hypothetical protein